jgi:hypothetical protein
MGGEDVLLLLIHDIATRWGEWSASRLSHALPPGEGPLVQEAVSAPEVTGKISSLPGIEPRLPSRAVCSQTLY